MKGLWKYLIPFAPDTSGFATAVNGTDGMALFDDIRGCAGNFLMADEVRKERPPRIFVSEIADEDVIRGTADKVLQRFATLYQELQPTPAFVLLCSCPVSSLIGTDLQYIADRITERTGVAAGAVDCSGYGTYDKGLSQTLEVMGKLLCEEPSKQRGGVNVLGANYLDWSVEDCRSLPALLRGEELPVLSQWGPDEETKNLRRAAEASVNWVVTAAGMPLARWMEAQWSIPYIAGAPFGRCWSNHLCQSLRTGVQPAAARSEGPAEVLLLCEQFTGNALREWLLANGGFRSVQVATFFQLEKSLAQPLDRKLKSEEDLLALLQSTSASIVVGDPLFNLPGAFSGRWIPLPHRPVSSRRFEDRIPSLAGEGTDVWLAEQLSSDAAF